MECWTAAEMGAQKVKNHDTTCRTECCHACNASSLAWQQVAWSVELRGSTKDAVKGDADIANTMSSSAGDEYQQEKVR